MRFELTGEQRDFAAAVDALLSASDPVGVARAWADGHTGPGLSLWQRLADQGVQALLVPEQHDGMGASHVELAVAFELLGKHVVPGPWVETVAYLPTALLSADLADSTDAGLLPALAAGAVATVAAPPHTPYAVDAGVAEHVLLATPAGLQHATPGRTLDSVDRTRRLSEVGAGTGAPGEIGYDAACDAATLATAAELVGAGQRVLDDSVAYVKQRRQFGREIGSYQAIKHALADVRIALDFARPLVFGAALREVPASAAKVACGDAAYRALRTGLQVHGAVGYTQELDLSLWLARIRALVTAWGTPAFHRSRLLEELTR